MNKRGIEDVWHKSERDWKKAKIFHEITTVYREKIIPLLVMQMWIAGIGLEHPSEVNDFILNKSSAAAIKKLKEGYGVVDPVTGLSFWESFSKRCFPKVKVLPPDLQARVDSSELRYADRAWYLHLVRTWHWAEDLKIYFVPYGENYVRPVKLLNPPDDGRLTCARLSPPEGSPPGLDYEYNDIKSSLYNNISRDEYQQVDEIIKRDFDQSLAQVGVKIGKETIWLVDMYEDTEEYFPFGVATFGEVLSSVNYEVDYEITGNKAELGEWQNYFAWLKRKDEDMGEEEYEEEEEEEEEMLEEKEVPMPYYDLSFSLQAKLNWKKLTPEIASDIAEYLKK